MNPHVVIRIEPLTAELCKKERELMPFLGVIGSALLAGIRRSLEFVVLLDLEGKLECMLHFEILKEAKQVRLFVPNTIMQFGSYYSLWVIVSALRHARMQYQCRRFCWAFIRGSADENRAAIEQWTNNQWTNGDYGHYDITVSNFPQHFLSPQLNLFYERWENQGERKIVRINPGSGAYARKHWITNEERALEMYKKMMDYVTKNVQPNFANLSETERHLYDILDQHARENDMEMTISRLAKAMHNTALAEINMWAIHSIERSNEERGRYFAFSVLPGAESDTVIQEGILFRQEGHLLVITHMTRFMMGLVQRVKRDVQTVPGVDELFRMVMRFNKEELGCTTLAIQHMTWGSTDVLKRNKTEDAQERGVEITVPQEDLQKYSVDAFRIDRRLCDGPSCIYMEGTHGWAHAPEYAFCGAKCAREKWHSLQ